MLSNESFVVRLLRTGVFNRGASQKLNETIQPLGKSAALIVTDKNLAQSCVLTPAFAVLDPDLTVRLPKYPSATCGYDVLTHAVEAFVALGANAYSDAIALEAIGKVVDYLRRGFEDGSDVEARSQMLLGSAMAAMAFNLCGLGSVHGTGHAISARLNAAHGQTLATMLPHVMEYNMPEREEKYAINRSLSRLRMPAVRYAKLR